MADPDPRDDEPILVAIRLRDAAVLGDLIACEVTGRPWSLRVGRDTGLAYQIVAPPHASARAGGSQRSSHNLLGYRTPAPPTTSTSR